MYYKDIVDLNIKFVIMSAPSGTGKTTLVKKLLQDVPSLVFSVSTTTRKPRAGEVEGKDYYFVSKEEFLHKVAQHKFIEFEEVYPGVFYGTTYEEIAKMAQLNKNIIFEIDVQGATRLKRKLKEKSFAIFIYPPSMEELERRLLARGDENEKSVENRLQKAKKEINNDFEFDMRIVNEELEPCYKAIKEKTLSFLGEDKKS